MSVTQLRRIEVHAEDDKRAGTVLAIGIRPGAGGYEVTVTTDACQTFEDAEGLAHLIEGRLFSECSPITRAHP